MSCVPWFHCLPIAVGSGGPGGQSQPVLAGIAFGSMSAVYEELGWRGFARPALEKRFSPLVSGLLVGLMWGAWHLRLNVTMAAPGEPWFLHLLSSWGLLGLPAL